MWGSQKIRPLLRLEKAHLVIFFFKVWRCKRVLPCILVSSEILICSSKPMAVMTATPPSLRIWTSCEKQIVLHQCKDISSTTWNVWLEVRIEVKSLLNTTEEEMKPPLQPATTGSNGFVVRATKMCPFPYKAWTSFVVSNVIPQPNPAGYDEQWYHLVLIHDPTLTVKMFWSSEKRNCGCLVWKIHQRMGKRKFQDPFMLSCPTTTCTWESNLENNWHIMRYRYFCLVWHRMARVERDNLAKTWKVKTFLYILAGGYKDHSNRFYWMHVWINH